MPTRTPAVSKQSGNCSRMPAEWNRMPPPGLRGRIIGSTGRKIRADSVGLCGDHSLSEPDERVEVIVKTPRGTNARRF